MINSIQLLVIKLVEIQAFFLCRCKPQDKKVLKGANREIKKVIVGANEVDKKVLKGVNRDESVL